MVKSKSLPSKKNVDDQKLRIAELKNLLTYYKDITETIREPFLILNNKFLVVTANPSFYKKFKVKKADTEGVLIYNLGNNQWNIPELKILLNHILPKHQKMNNYMVSHDFPSLGHKTMLLNARQIDAKQLILLAIEDVTSQLKDKKDIKDATTRLINQRNQLQEMNDAKQDFISLASHQLRTPATAVKQYVGMLTEGYAGELNKEQMKMLVIAYQSNQRQLEIIEDLLRIAKVDDGKVYLEKSLYNVVEQIEVAIGNQKGLYTSRRQSIVFHKPRHEIQAYMDGKLIVMVIDNLLDNAGKYSMGGQQVDVNLDQNNEYTSISVKDNGVGIKLKDRSKLFKKFSRIDNPLSVPAGGTGLGLYWVKKILDLHDGILEVESKARKGSTFTIKIPVYKK